jgi:ATP-dependent helicase/DNAse subunit B
MSEKKGKRDEKLLRTIRTGLLFNQREKEAIDLYCHKYEIKNKSKFMREIILTEVLKRFDEDYPTLFEFEKPNLFYQNKP